MAESRIILPHSGWRCRPYQNDVWKYLNDGGKRAVCLWHRRAGKDEVALHWTAVSAARKPAVYWHMLPQAEQARKAIWDAVNPHSGRRRIEEVWPDALIASKREDIMQIKLKNGALWQVVGSDNYNSLIGSPPYGVVFSEWAIADPVSWDYIRPILAENGGWAIWPYTPRGHNHGYELFEQARAAPGWFCQKLTIDDTRVIDMSIIDDERASGMTEEQVQQEYYCSFTAPHSGSYYGSLMNDAMNEKRIIPIKPDKVLGVTTAWDLGIGDTTAIWLAQVVGMEIHLIDYHVAAGQPLEYYVRWLEDRAAQMGYRYAEHLLPHDAEARELGTGVTRIETLQKFNLKGPMRIVERHRVEDGINAVRVTLPNCWFDAERCDHRNKFLSGLHALRAYRRAYDEKTRSFASRPLHDWASNGCFDGSTKVLTHYGARQIMDLPETGEVWTPCGWKHYHSPRITLKNAPLVEVAFSDGLTVRCTLDHRFLTAGGWKSAESLTKNTPILSSLMPSLSISMVAFSAAGRAANTIRAVAGYCIEKLGGLRSGRYQTDIISITGMATSPTTLWSILNVSLPLNTFPFHGLSIVGSGSSISAKMPERRLLSGIDRMPDDFGIAVMRNDPRVGQSGSARTGLARSALSFFWRLFGSLVIARGFAPNAARWLTIASVRPLQKRADVWDITVPDGHWFSLENGATVHNSDAFRYLCVGLRPQEARNAALATRRPYEKKPARTGSWMTA